MAAFYQPSERREAPDRAARLDEMRTARARARPLPLFALALALLLVVIVSTLEVRSPTCAATRPEPAWFAVAFWGAGPLSVLAASGSTAALGIRRGWRPYRTLLATVVTAAVWTFVGLYAVVGLLVGPCLS
jgi:hypothetical protein